MVNNVGISQKLQSFTTLMGVFLELAENSQAFSRICYNNKTRERRGLLFKTIPANIHNVD